MSGSVILQFEEAAHEAMSVAQALQGDPSVMNMAVPHAGEGSVWLGHLHEARRWLNTPVSLSRVIPTGSDGTIRRG